MIPLTELPEIVEKPKPVPAEEPVSVLWVIGVVVGVPIVSFLAGVLAIAMTIGFGGGLGMIGPAAAIEFGTSLTLGSFLYWQLLPGDFWKSLFAFIFWALLILIGSALAGYLDYCLFPGPIRGEIPTRVIVVGLVAFGLFTTLAIWMWSRQTPPEEGKPKTIDLPR